MFQQAMPHHRIDDHHLASAFASSMSFTIKSLIIFLILPKGSELALVAINAKYLLPSFCARPDKNSTTRCLTRSWPDVLRNWGNADFVWRRDAGKCFSPMPVTSSL